MNLYISLTGSDNLKLIHGLSELEPFNKKPPTVVVVDDFKRYEGSPDWIDKWFPNCKYEVTGYWGQSDQDYYKEGFLDIHRNFDIVKININDYPRDAQSVLAMLEPLPWMLAEFRTIHTAWYNPEHQYFAPGFKNTHYDHGWGCAFKGEGHRELVSRRWLEFGPWHVLKGANDTTLVQFHDLEADCDTALAQAKIGHERMGITPTGGVIVFNFRCNPPIKGLYTLEERKLEIVTIERKISQSEMLDCCAARYHQALGPDRPIDNLAYVFMKEDEAREHLHELWLREIECWTFVNGSRTRIDIDYHPIPQKPDWVKRLEEQEQI